MRYYCVPAFFKDKKNMLLAFAVIAVTIICTYIIAEYHMEMPVRRQNALHSSMRFARKGADRIKLHQQAAWFMYLVVLSFSMAVGFLNQLYKQILRQREIENEKNKAELAVYKAQINPHFLFNSLNTLYGLMLSDTQRAEVAFMQFIDMMKYMYNDSIKDKVNVVTEVHYIEEYIELQKNRFNEHTSINFSYFNDHKNPELKIIPMLLMTFVENALKYGSSSHIDSIIYIAIRVENGELSFTTQNPVMKRKKENEPEGMGIANCRKRMELVYPDKYGLEVNEKDNEFVVTLSIKLLS